MTLEEFAADRKLDLTSTSIKERPDKDPDDWRGDHWHCVLKHQGKVFLFFYTKGLGHREVAMRVTNIFGIGKGPLVGPPGTRNYLRKGTVAWQESYDATPPPPPTMKEVLESLHADFASFDVNGTFEDWASEYGFDTDSRKAYATWEQLRDQRASFFKLLGPTLFELFLSAEVE